jgi:hypothetical protein
MVILSIAVTVVWMCGSIRADEIQDLRQQLENQYKAMQDIQNRLIELETKQKQQDEQFKAFQSDRAAFQIPETLKWAEKLKFYGDFRFRYQNISSETNGGNTDAVNRQRIRVRLGLTTQVNEEVTFDMRITTGKYDSATLTANGDPTATNSTLGDSWTYKGIWLDRAYMTWKPAAVEGLSVLAGKFGTPFYTAGRNELIWDGDLNMEGIAAQYNVKMNDKISLFANAGGFYVRMEDSDTDSISMWGAQGGAIIKLNETDKLTGGAGYYDYANLIGETTLIKSSTATSNYARGNSIQTSSPYTYLYDYDLLEGFAEYGTKVGEMPASLYGNYVVNTASGVSENTGWIVGAILNQCKDPGSWEFGYNYRELKKDCVVGAFSDSDFAGGGTGNRGHRFSIAYQLAKSTQAILTYNVAKKANSAGDIEDNYQLIQMDILLKF